MSLDPARDAEIRAFLARHAWGDAARTPLAEDASTRRYERLVRDGETGMLMDAPGRGEDPPCPPDADAETRRQLGWNATSRLAASRVDAFVALARHLKALGLSAPAIIAAEPDRGLAIVEDLGAGLVADTLAREGALEPELYGLTGSLLAHVQETPAPLTLPVDETGSDWPLLRLDDVALGANVDLFADWLPVFAGREAMSAAERAEWNARRDDLVAAISAQPHALTLRDVHAENLIWRPDREGLSRIGLLDFQDAVIGPRAWDLSMLLHDARRDVSEAAHEAALAAYLEASGQSDEPLRRDLAVAGLANTLRIIGIFARLVSRDGKTRYRSFMPREWGHLARILETPGLEAFAPMIEIGAPGWRRHAA